MQQNISKKIMNCLNIIERCKLLLRRKNKKKGLWMLQCFSQEFMLLLDDIIYAHIPYIFIRLEFFL